MAFSALATPLETLVTKRSTEATRKPIGDAVAAAQLRHNRLTFRAVGLVVDRYAGRWRLDVTGAERLPADGPAILAANHLSFIDSPLLMYRLPRRVWMLGKAEYMDSPVSRFLFPALGMIPLDRSRGRAALEALKAGVAVLESSQCLGIYPEGTRSRDGNLYRGHTGLAWLAFRSRAPVFPIGIRGTAEVHPPGARLPRLQGTCCITIGEPLTVDRYPDGTKRDHREFTDDVMFEISQLSGQRYVDRYAEQPASS